MRLRVVPFCLNFISSAAANSTPSISFELPEEDLYADAMTYGWDFLKLQSQGMCEFLKISPRTTMKLLTKELVQTVLKKDIKRVCIDPISVLSMYLKENASVREYVFELTSLLKRFSITTLIADETIEGAAECLSMGSEDIGTQSIKFLK